MNEQTQRALALANEIRNESARWRREIAKLTPEAGRVELARTLEHNGFRPEIGALRLRRFLTAGNRIGEQKASTICDEASIYRRNPRVRDLTLRERSSLAAVLRRWDRRR